MQWAVSRWDVGVIHAQSHFAAGVAAKALEGRKLPKLIFDVHGVDLEEALADGRLMRGTSRYRLREEMQVEAVQRADWLLPVSETLARYLQSEVETTGRVRVVPCVSSLPVPARDLEAVRKEARVRLGVQNRPVVLYLGGASAWQQPKFLVQSFAALQQRQPEVVLLLITGNPDKFKRLLSEVGVSSANFRIMTVAHDEVPMWVPAADVGLLLREDSIINRVASPTKFAEYLTLGVPVALTEVLSDFAAIVRREEVGKVIPSGASPEMVAATIQPMLSCLGQDAQAALRRRCQRVAQSQLSFRSVLPSYRKIYGGAVDIPKHQHNIGYAE